MMQLRSRLSCLVLSLVSLWLVVSCTSTNPPTGSAPSVPPSPSEIAAVRLGFSAWPGWFPWQVAGEKRLFDKNQVTVQLAWYDGYLDSIKALKADQLDANTQTLNDTISSIADGAEQVIVLVNDNSTGNDQIIVRKEIGTIADLKGKKVAAEPGTVDHFLLLLGLKKAGIALSDIDFQPMETGAAAAAFVAGKVDAVGVFAPFTTQTLKRSGSKVLFTSKDFPGAIPDHLVFSRKFVTDHADKVQAIVNTWFDTLKFIQRDRPEAYTIMARRAGVSLAEYQEYDAGTRIFTLEENLKAFAPGTEMASLPYAAKEISKFLLESKLIEKEPDLSRILDDRFIKVYAVSHQKDPQ